MKVTVVILVATAVTVGLITVAWEHVAREQMRSEVAKDCIAGGGRYHETMFRRRPICKPHR